MSKDKILSRDIYIPPVETRYYKNKSKNKDNSLNFGQFLLNFFDDSYWDGKAFLIHDNVKMNPNGTMFPGIQVYCILGATVRIDYRDSTEKSEKTEENGFSLVNRIHAWGTPESVQKVKDTLIKKLKDSEIKD